MRAGERDLRVTAARESTGVSLDIRLRDIAGTPINSWSPALILSNGGDLYAGRIGQRAMEQRFYSDRPITPQVVNGATMWVLAAGFEWRGFPVPAMDGRHRIDIELSVVRPETSVVRCTPVNAERRSVFLGLPFDARTPTHLLPPRRDGG